MRLIWQFLGPLDRVLLVGFVSTVLAILALLGAALLA